MNSDPLTATLKAFLLSHAVSGPILVAVSGGADSIALLHLIGALHRELLLQPEILHFNHRLRGQESDQDEQFVFEQAEKWQFPIHVGRSTLPVAVAGSHSEDQLRKDRYQFFEEIARKHKIRSLLLAHHRDDQLETLLQRLIRGTGLRGWQGIPAQRPLNETAQIYRPLLAFTKAELLAYLNQHQFEFRTDATNNQPLYTRNRIRHELIPLLESIDPGASEQIFRWHLQAIEIQQFHQQFTDDLIVKSLISQSADEVRLRLQPLQMSHPLMMSELLIAIWEQQRWPRGKMQREHWQKIQQLIALGTGELHLPGKIRCQIRGAALVIKK